MAEVQRNLAKLTAEDQNAMAEFIKTLPAIPSDYKATQAGGMMQAYGAFGSAAWNSAPLRPLIAGLPAFGQSMLPKSEHPTSVWERAVLLAR